MVQVNKSNEKHIVVGQRYRLLRQVGQKGPAEFWEASDMRLDRPVSLCVLSEQSRHDRAAQADLRLTARQARSDDRVEASRILDGGEDPTYGPFVVAELSNDVQATQPLPTFDSPPSSRLLRPNADFSLDRSTRREFVGRLPAPTDGLGTRPRPHQPVARANDRSRVGVLALVALVGLVLAALGFLVRTFAPADPSSGTPAAIPTLEQPARPLSGAPTNEPAPTAPIVPTLAASQPASAPTPTKATTQPTIEPTRPPTPQPKPPTAAPAQAAVTGSPVDTIRQHYALIEATRYADGYALMDAHMRSLNSPAEYAGWFANKVSIKPISVDLVSQTDTESVVHSVVETTDHVNGQDVTTQLSEKFVMRKENGAWRIDKVSQI